MSVAPTISRAAFGTLADGKAIEAYSLANGHGLEARILIFGGTLQSLRVPDAKGDAADVVLGFDSIEGYEGEHPYFGGLIGRYGNRIARGRFLLDGREHVLHCNNGPNHLHGGARGFDRVVWSAEPELTPEEARLHLRYVSADGEEGYPGALACVVVYAITRANELRIDYEARTGRPTLVNLTHHSYFNLSGHPRNGIREHRLSVDADAYLPVDQTLIPLGEAQSVAGTPFDLRTPVTLDERLASFDSQLQIGRGFDHNFVLNGWNADTRLSRRCASVSYTHLTLPTIYSV